MTKVTKEMINAAHDVTMKSKLMLGHELLEKIYLAMDSQRTWVGLTDEEANELWESTDSDWELMKRTEAKLKEKNT